MGPELPDLIAGLVSLISLIAFVQFWKPKYRPEYHAKLIGADRTRTDEESHHIGSTHSSTESKEEKQQIEDVNDQTEGSIQSNKHTVTHHENTEDRPSMEVQKPNLRETLLAWSPWTIIVIVVIV